ncbi:ParB/RepB/Spo0J family partition protein [Caulobacter sp. FWC2]|uniref:ParB/RepB/Spo0J family partition protein n=1 Tax=Caulobacter sp. FWC2 TaxID=69664 RepID=UPI000C14B6D2|nr:ParB/RepB/Spo0J family partition protein [Caulobacter sp. FWC2]PIB92616.1 chromosome partitioning protein ParB [Caulobacter sp. FWC2]
MTTQQTPAAPKAASSGPIIVQYGEVRDIPLNKLKASPKNVRRVGHSAQVIESRAASITYKGVLQPLVVEPEVKDGRETGYYLVSAGEGRRQALRLLAKRKALAKGAPVRCVVDTTNDPAEVSMDENLSREPMHPADQFEAFKDLAERKGYGAEEIGARFGVKPEIVRQRLRLGAVAPALLDLYREEALTLDQVMAFAVNPDPERQMQVYAQLPAGNRQPQAIRRAMTDTKVAADDTRVRFVGLDAYVAAGGPVLRDLFTPDNEGWLEDVVLLDRLVGEKLVAMAQDIREREGWKWASAHLAFPHGHGCSRIWEHALTRTPEAAQAIAALQAEEAALTDQWADIDPPPPEVAARIEAIQAELEAYGDDYGHTPEEKARAGVLVVLTPYGEARIDRGFVRPEDEPTPEPEPELEAEAEAEGEGARAPFGPGDEHDEGDDDEGREGGDVETVGETEDPAGDPAAPLPDRVIAELTAHRSAALRDALAQNPDLAQVALVHALVSRVFGMGSAATCLDIRWGSRDLNQFGEGIEDSPAGLAIAERHRLWARQMPTRTEDFWDFVVGLDGDRRDSLLAHCVSLTLDGVKSWERRPATVLAHVETLATALDLDMRAYWKPTAMRYLDRVTKAQIVAAVGDGVSGEAAARLTGLKKPDMVAIAEPLLVEAGWLPAVLRTVKPEASEPEASEPDPAMVDGDEEGGAAFVETEADGAEAEAEAIAATSLDPAEPLTDEAEPLATLGDADQPEAALSEAEADEVEALLPVAG